MNVTAAFDPEAYMASLFEQQATLGAQYVRRQVEWAEGILQDRLTKKSSSVADCCAPGEGSAAIGRPSPSAATSGTVERERTHA